MARKIEPLAFTVTDRGGYWMVDPPGGLHDDRESAIAWILRLTKLPVDIRIRPAMARRKAVR